MKKRGYGRIVLTSSSSGMFSHQGLSNYAAAKLGLYGLTKALAFEGAPHGIKVNAVLPFADSGRFARVFVGVADGWLAQDPAAVTAEAIAEHFDEIRVVLLQRPHVTVRRDRRCAAPVEGLTPPADRAPRPHRSMHAARTARLARRRP